MATNRPTISILMPTLNVHKYINKSLPSLLNQSREDFELLILDGGSTDGTLEYLSGVDDSRIEIFQDCGSIVESLNKGLDESRGDYIARADGDSVPEPIWLEKCIDFLESNPNHAAVGAQARRILPDGSSYVTEKPTTFEELTQTLIWKNPIIHPTMVMRKQPLKEIGGYRERHWEDHDLVIRLVNHSHVANLSDILLTDYVRDEGIVRSTSTIRWVAANLRCTLLALKMTNHSLLEILQSAREIVIPFIYKSVYDKCSNI